jgi:hypothetical protein
LLRAKSQIEYVSSISNKSSIDNVKLFIEKIEKYQSESESSETIDKIIIAIIRILPDISQNEEESVKFIVEFFSIGI